MKKSSGAEKKRVKRQSGSLQNGIRDSNSDTPPRVCSSFPVPFFFFLGFSKFFSPLSFKVRMFRSFSRAFVLCLLILAVKFGVNVGIFWCCYWLEGSSVLD